jgi:hypothetical protein
MVNPHAENCDDQHVPVQVKATIATHPECGERANSTND